MVMVKAMLEGWVVKYKYHIVSSILLCSAISALLLLAPRFVTVLAYFWPLCISTAVFLLAVLVFGHTLPVTPLDSSAGEGLLDYVAGHPDDLLLSPEEATFQTHDHDHHSTTTTTEAS